MCGELVVNATANRRVGRFVAPIKDQAALPQQPRNLPVRSIGEPIRG